MGRQSFASLSLTLSCIFAAIGCSSGKVNLGHNDPPAVLGASLNDYEGSWEGYTEAYKWTDSTDLVRLRLDGDGNGVLEVGSVDAPEPDFSPDPSTKPDLKPLPSALSPGFSYEVAGAKVTSRRIRIETASDQVYEPWCSTFTPVADAVNPGMFSCIPNLGWSYDAGDPQGCRLMDASRTPIDCTSVYCAKLCACTEASCAPLGTQTKDVQIDAALMNEGEELIGTLLAGSERINLRMFRAP